MPPSDSRSQKLSLTLLAYLAVAIVIILTSFGMLGLYAISPLVAVIIVVYAISAGWGLHSMRHDPTAWSFPGFWVSLSLSGILIYLQIAAGFAAAYLGGGLASIVLAGVGITFVFSISTGVITQGKSFYAILSPVPISAIHLNFAILLGMPIAVLNLGVIQQLLRWFSVNPVLEITELLLARQPLWWGLVVICLLPAIGEEVLFRGLIGRGLIARYGQLAGVIITSLLFAMIHLNALQTVTAFLVGVVLHVVYLWTGSIWAPMALHFVNNATVLVLVKFTSTPDIQAGTQHSGNELHITLLLTYTALIAAAGLLLAIATSRRQFGLSSEREILLHNPPVGDTQDAKGDEAVASCVTEDCTTGVKPGVWKDARVSHRTWAYWLVGLTSLVTMLVMMWQTVLRMNFQ